MHIFHKWEIVQDCGTHQYIQCVKPGCPKRRIVHNWDTRKLGYPTDAGWITSGRFRSFGSPPIKPA